MIEFVVLGFLASLIGIFIMGVCLGDDETGGAVFGAIILAIGVAIFSVQLNTVYNAGKDALALAKLEASIAQAEAEIERAQSFMIEAEEFRKEVEDAAR